MLKGRRSYTKIVPFNTHHIEEDFHGSLWPVESEEVGECKNVYFRHVSIPCGKCIGCRLDYSRTWANRLMMEYKYHRPEDCWFVTLTYDNENVPVNYYSDDKTGEALPCLTLHPRDITLFHKTLRNLFPENRIRFYLSGEYGETTHRPHYHAVYFGLSLDFQKLVVWKRTDQGFTLYKCPELEKIWRKGNVLVSSVSWSTCAYVSRYVTKKLNGSASEFYERFNIEPEFCRMSRKPGIGRQYFEDHPDCIKKGIHLATDTKGFNFQAPRYFKQLFALDNEVEYVMMSVEGSVKQDDLVNSKKLINDLARQDFLSYLEREEQEKQRAAKMLKRGDI